MEYSTGYLLASPSVPVNVRLALRIGWRAGGELLQLGDESKVVMVSIRLWHESESGNTTGLISERTTIFRGSGRAIVCLREREVSNLN